MTNCDELECAGNGKWSLRLFQGFQLRSPGGCPVDLGSQHFVELLHLVALQPELSMERGSLARALFWNTEANFEARLTVLLSRSRKKLNLGLDGFLRSSSESVWLSPDHIDVDVHVAFDLIDEIRKTALSGKSVALQIESLGHMASSSNENAHNPFVERTLKTYRFRLLKKILTALVPVLGVQYRSSLESLVEVFQIEDPSCMDTCLLLMELYAKLGNLPEVHRIFATYEDYVETEYGEPAPVVFTSCYEKVLATEPIAGLIPSITFVPAMPSFSTGFHGLCEHVKNLLLAHTEPLAIGIVGPVGSGKSHCLSLLYHSLSQDSNPVFVDYSRKEPNQLVLAEIRGASNLILVDNVDEDFQAFSLDVLRVKASNTVIYATTKPDSIPGSISLHLPKLGVGSRLSPGPGIELMLHHTKPSHKFGVSKEMPSDLQSTAKLVELSGGLPSAIVNLAQMANVLGEKHTLEFVRNDFSAISPHRASTTSQSLKTRVRQIFDSLTVLQRTLCRVLARLGGTCSTKMMVDTLGFTITEFSELESMGILTISAAGEAELNGLVVELLNGVSSDELGPSAWREFCESVSFWYQQQTDAGMMLFELEGTMTAIKTVCHSLFSSGRSSNGLVLYSLLSKSFGNSEIDFLLVDEAEAQLLCSNDFLPAVWIDCVSAVGRGLFHGGRYRRMLDMLLWAQRSHLYLCLKAQQRVRPLNQLGLAFRSVGDHENARRCYESALALDPQDGSEVALHFNLGCQEEYLGDDREALRQYEAASARSRATTDRRLVADITIGILRIRSRLGESLDQCEGLVEEMLAEQLRSGDSRSLALMLLEVGTVMKCRASWESALAYLASGILLYMQGGINRDFLVRCAPSLREIQECLDRIKLSSKSVLASILAAVMEQREDLALAKEDTAPCSFRGALREVLIQCLGTDALGSAKLPGSFELICERCEVLKREGFEQVQVVPYVTYLASQLKRDHDETQITAELNAELPELESR